MTIEDWDLVSIWTNLLESSDDTYWPNAAIESDIEIEEDTEEDDREDVYRRE